MQFYTTIFSILDQSGRVQDRRNIYLLTNSKWKHDYEKERVIVAQLLQSHFSAMSWLEQVTLDEIIMKMSTLY
jgi:hypothetical protein